MAFKLPYQCLSLNNIIIVQHWFPYILTSPQFRLEANLQHFEGNFWNPPPDPQFCRPYMSNTEKNNKCNSALCSFPEWHYIKCYPPICYNPLVNVPKTHWRFCKLCLALKNGMRQNKYSLIPTVMWWILNSTSQNKFMVALMPVRYAVKVQLSIGLCNFLRGHATSHH